MMVNEAQLLSGLKKGSKNSISKAIELYTPYLSTVLYNMVGNALPQEDLEEIVSDVFVSLWKNAEYIDLKKGTLRAYIATIARNYALKRLNRVKEYASLDGIDLPDEKNRFEDAVGEEQIWKYVMELGEPDNEIFVRFYKYGESIKDIQYATGLNTSTIKSKLLRGKQNLKKIISDAEESL